MSASRAATAETFGDVTRRVRGGVFAIAWVLCGIPAVTGVTSAADGQRERRFHDELVPLLRTYCYDCHGDQDGEGGITLEADTTADAVMRNRGVWLRAARQVRSEAMPPPHTDTVDPATRTRLAELIEEMANAVDCVQNPNPGRVVLRRLNRSEYYYTVLDLLGVRYGPALSFPGDETGYGFDNIGDVLNLPPLLLEKYLSAAEEISSEAILTPPPARLFQSQYLPTELDGADRFTPRRGGLNINSNGAITLTLETPFAATYDLEVTASGDQAGNEPCRMEVRVNGRVARVVDVPTVDPEVHTVRVRLPRGKPKVSFGFINDYYNKQAGEDRNLWLGHLRIVGRERTRSAFLPSDLPESHKRIVFMTPGNDVSVAAARDAVLERLMSRAYRRPARPDEIARLGELVDRVVDEGGTFEQGIQLALQTVLVSPNFLFKVEIPGDRRDDGTYPRVSDFELATRMSYFLWSSMPDDELLRAAWKKKLRDPNVLTGQVARMLKDDRIKRFIDRFAGQWLQLRNLASAQPDPQRFPAFDESIRRSMRLETLNFFAGVMQRNQPVTQLLDADYSYLNEEMAGYYGIDGVVGPEFRPVRLDPARRGGLLGQASVLTVTSNPTRTSPVKRGKWVMDNLLGTPPPAPPPDIPELERNELVGTLRQRMEQHRADPACASCHRVMDSLGFALENFDAVGRWRERDEGDPIDASGEFPDGMKFAGFRELREVLIDRHREDFVRCLAEKMLTYALGRGIEYHDKCTIDEIVAFLKRNDDRFAYLVLGIVQSDPFQRIGHREDHE